MARRTQAERVERTRGALLAAATNLFGAYGYTQVSLDQVSTSAKVTRGALYHHFRDKADLFRAVYTDLEAQCLVEMTAVIGDITDTETDIRKAVSAYLDICQRPHIRRICLLDAPLALGWHEWRRIEADFSLGVMTARLTMARNEGVMLAAEPAILSALLLSAANEAAMLIADANDPQTTRRQAEAALIAVLHGVIKDFRAVHQIGPADHHEPADGVTPTRPDGDPLGSVRAL